MVAIKKLLIPIGPALTGAVVFIPAAAGLSKLADEYAPLLFFGILIIGILVFVLALRNMQVSLNGEIETWCINLEPKLYRDYGDQVRYLKEAKSEYAVWLRSRWRVPPDDVRRAKFSEIIESLTNMTSEQMIREGLKEMKRNAQQSL